MNIKKWLLVVWYIIIAGLITYINMVMGYMIATILHIDFDITKINWGIVILIGLGLFIIVGTIISLWEKKEDRKWKH